MSNISYMCSHCSATFTRKQVLCPRCGEIDSIIRVENNDSAKNAGFRGTQSIQPSKKSQKLSEITGNEVSRIATGINELDRVLGGGIVESEVILFSGQPGSGKSTLSLTIAEQMSQKGLKILYSSGEESVSQIALRAQRMGITSQNISVVNETNLETLLGHIEQDSPDFVIIDSLQTLASSSIPGTIGSIQQSRECAHVLTNFAKKHNIRMLLISQVTKNDEFAGSNQISHIVDATLVLESDKDSPFRFLRTLKNRFGSTSEVGVFQHETKGLVSVSQLDSFFVSDDDSSCIGSSKTFITDGIRNIPCEIQALVVDSSLNNPRKQFTGVNYNRGQTVCAVLSQRCKLRIYEKDVFMSTVAGLKIDDPQCDLAIAASLISSSLNKEIDTKTLFIGEVHLTGRVKGNYTIKNKINEAQRLGFTTIIIPYNCLQYIDNYDSSLTIITIKSIEDLKNYVNNTL